MRKGAAATSPKGKEHRAWENENISVCIMSVSDIAEALGTHRDTIYREFKRCNATLKTYTAAAGQQAL